MSIHTKEKLVRRMCAVIVYIPVIFIRTDIVSANIVASRGTAQYKHAGGCRSSMVMAR